MAVEPIARVGVGGPAGGKDVGPGGHRLAELVQALTGCDAERAELALASCGPSRAMSLDDALDTVARALVRVGPQASPGRRCSPAEGKR